MRHSNPFQKWTIKTDGSNQEPPMIILGTRFLNLNTRIRPLTAGDGEPYELNQSEEWVREAPEPDHPVHINRQQVYGLDRDRSTVKGHGSRVIIVTFQAYQSSCLLGKVRKWQEDEAKLDVVCPGGHVPNALVTAVDMVRTISANHRFMEFDVTFEEFGP